MPDEVRSPRDRRVWTAPNQARMWRTSYIATILLVVVIVTARALLWHFEGR